MRHDEHLAARGGTSSVVTVGCAFCEESVITYQKDGGGPLLRCYVDRVLGPKDVVLAGAHAKTIEDLHALACPHCAAVLGDPMRHLGDRLAYRLRPEAVWFSPSAPSDHAELVDAIAVQRGVPADDVRLLLRHARASLRPRTTEVVVSEHGYERRLAVARTGFGPLRLGSSQAVQVDFTASDHWGRYTAIVFGPLDKSTRIVPAGDPIAVRIDSGCTSGQVFGDRTCDCRAQLDTALARCAMYRNAIVIHVPGQDGRGCGGGFKLATLGLQQQLGLDTVDAAKLMALDGHIDRRTYGGSVAVLRTLGVPAGAVIDLLSSNPEKAAVLHDNGYKVIPSPMALTVDDDEVRRHLTAKRDKLGHTVEFDALDTDGGT